MFRFEGGEVFTLSRLIVFLESLYCGHNKENDSCIKNYLNYYQKGKWLKCDVSFLLKF